MSVASSITMIMRTIDIFYAFPSVLLAIAISGALGAGIFNSAALADDRVHSADRPRRRKPSPPACAICDFVDAARASGANALTIMRVHVLGNVLGPDLRLCHQPDQRLA
jgi:peptide/nickel transport system permease protein